MKLTKVRIKSWLHLAGLVAAIGGAAYVSLRQGLSIGERMGAMGILFATLKTATGQILIQVDKAIDEIPNDLLPPGSPPAAAD